MEQKLQLSSDLYLPFEISGRRTAIFGISGSGKSNTASLLIEQLLHAGEQVVLVDPKGEGWGLLSKANGKPSNLPLIVFGEPNGHISALNESHGPRLADFVADTGRSVVLSLLGFESDQAERRFVATFLRQLYRRKSQGNRQRTRTLVVLEEAHLFVPEGVKGEGAELAGAVQRIVRQGRSFGLGTLIVDQRPQDVSKRVITQCDTLICHQLTHKTDRDALSDWVKGYDKDGVGAEFLKSLATLQPGEAWVWSPGWLEIFKRVRVDRRATYDSGAAPDGVEASHKVQRAEVDLDSLRGQLDEIVQQAKDNDPSALRKTISDLRAKLAKAESAVLVKTETKVIERTVFTKEQRKMVADTLGEVKGAKEVLVNSLAVLSGLQKEIDRKLAASPVSPSLNGHARAEAPNPRLSTPSPTATSRACGEASKSPTLATGTAKLTKCGRAILTALAQYPQGRSVAQILILTRYRESGTFSGELATFRREGLITTEQPIRITPAGLITLGAWDPLPTGQGLVDHWLRKLNKCGAAILKKLVDIYPDSLTTETLAESLNYKVSGTFSGELADLRALELIDRGKEIRASKELFT